MRHAIVVCCAALLVLPVATASAQFDDPAVLPEIEKPKAKAKARPSKGLDDAAALLVRERGVQLDESQTQIWKCGVQIRALGGPCGGLFGTIAVPTDWPEQSVRIGNEEITPNVRKVDYRTLEGGVKQMLISVPQLPAGETARAIITFEVERHSLKPPPDPTIFVLPTKMPLAVKKHLAPSPQIESNQAKIKKLAQELVEGKTSAWEQVEAIYDGVRERVKWENDNSKGALAALNDGKADKEDVTGAFVALCRAAKIPARLVWIPDSLYAEFYLEDDDGNGYWIPCYLANEEREFGFVSTHAPILQKGDNFKVPEKKEPQRFVAEFLNGKGAGGGRPEVEFIRRLEGIKP
jgi:transglutaminase-like putative cysteine protease